MSRQHKGSKRKARRASIERKRGAFGTGKTPPPGNKKPGASRAFAYCHQGGANRFDDSQHSCNEY